MTVRSGKSYERQVMRHLSEESNRVVFELDARIPDTTGSYERQIDVWLPQAREIIECKHFPNRPVGIEIVDRMVGTIRDAGAAGGHIFSSSGFTKHAQLRAQKATIKCTKLPFKSSFDMHFPPTGDGYYSGEYLDLCMLRSQDCDTWGCISYEDRQGNISSICTGLSVDWGDARMRGFVACMCYRTCSAARLLTMQ